MSTIKVSILHIYNQQINFVYHVKMPNNIYIYIYINNIFIYLKVILLFLSNLQRLNKITIPVKSINRKTN